MLLNYNSIDVNFTDNECDRSPIHYAAQLTSPEIMKLLMNVNGINLRRQDRDGKTLLHSASKSGCTDNVALLLESCAFDVNARDNKGQTPLHKARKVEIAKLLLATDSLDINAVDSDGNTALYCAVKNYRLNILDDHTLHQVAALLITTADIDV
eukprot:694531_1